MMIDDEGFFPDCYRDWREAMIEYMSAKDNGFDGNFQKWGEMMQRGVKRFQNDSALTAAIRDLKDAGLTPEAIRDMVDEVLT